MRWVAPSSCQYIGAKIPFVVSKRDSVCDVILLRSTAPPPPEKQMAQQRVDGEPDKSCTPATVRRQMFAVKRYLDVVFPENRKKHQHVLSLGFTPKVCATRR